MRILEAKEAEAVNPITADELNKRWDAMHSGDSDKWYRKIPD